MLNPHELTADSPLLSNVPSFLRVCPNADPKDGIYLQISAATPDPRTIKTHLPFSLLHPSMLDTAKVNHAHPCYSCSHKTYDHFFKESYLLLPGRTSYCLHYYLTFFVNVQYITMPVQHSPFSQVVYVIRNAKDVLLSFYHHSRLFPRLGFVGTTDDFCSYFITGDGKAFFIKGKICNT